MDKQNKLPMGLLMTTKDLEIIYADRHARDIFDFDKLKKINLRELTEDTTQIFDGQEFDVLVSKRNSFILKAEDVAVLKYQFFTVKENDEIKHYIILVNAIVKTNTNKIPDNFSKDFTLGIYHEIRTPINVINGALQLIKDNMDNKEKMEKYIRMIRRNSNIIQRLINNILALCRGNEISSEYRPKKIDLVDYIHIFVKNLEEFLQALDFSIEFDCRVGSCIISADTNHLDRIFTNLVSNAVKFSDKEKRIVFSLYEEDGQAILSVKDFGIGIAKENSNLIFEKYQQISPLASQNKEGSGIGLYIVKNLVEINGGVIHVNSKLGEGSNFIMAFPAISISMYPSLNEPTVTDDNHLIPFFEIELSDILQ